MYSVDSRIHMCRQCQSIPAVFYLFYSVLLVCCTSPSPFSTICLEVFQLSVKVRESAIPPSAEYIRPTVSDQRPAIHSVPPGHADVQVLLFVVVPYIINFVHDSPQSSTAVHTCGRFLLSVSTQLLVVQDKSIHEAFTCECNVVRLGAEGANFYFS